MTLHSLQTASGTAFDPEAVRAVIRMLPGRWMSPREREVLVSELAPERVLARGIHTASGVLLVSAGHALNEESIAMIRSNPPTDPITQVIAIFRR